jgi:hypothetical protein
MATGMPTGRPMSHFAAVLGFIGRLYAIRHALTYDLRDDMRNPKRAFDTLWHTNMKAWRLAALP